ncbi:ATPdependent RNA helicase, partial [Bulinus truncatus]
MSVFDKLKELSLNLSCPNLTVDPEAAQMIDKTLQDISKSDLTSSLSDNSSELEDKVASQKQRHSPDEVSRVNKLLYKEFQGKTSSGYYQKMLEERRRLPAWNMKNAITDATARHQVIIISGMTGCGKTTQVPQFILDDALQSENFSTNIICTQPRRISAMSVAERVAAERDDTLGRIVGYQIRLDGEMSQFTRLLFCTTGIVLRRLEGDPDLQEVSHVIIDEVHERTEQSDFLILVIKKLLVRRPDLRVILMSATIDARLFSEYFDNCPIIDIPGKLYPVKQLFLEDIIEKIQYYLPVCSEYSRSDYRHVDSTASSESFPDSRLSETQFGKRYSGYSASTISTLSNMDFEKVNYELLVKLLEWIVTGKHEDFPDEGAILVFLPGYQEIQTVYDLLQLKGEFASNKDKYIIIPLHSSFSTEEQRAVFLPTVPGVRKIVLSTNIAETSVTIDDIVYVVDTGRMREMRYDHSKSMQSLDLIWVSRTNAVQRMGRAGRVQEGVCFHMFTSHMFNYEFREHPVPEIQRNSLEQVLIRTKILSIFKNQDVEAVLQNLIDPPPPESIHGAVQRLKDLGALDSQMELTALGYHLGCLPVDVRYVQLHRIGKLMLYGAIFRCLDATLTIAATLSFKSPFICPFKKREEATAKKKSFSTQGSDILTMHKAYMDWWEERKYGKNKAYGFCKENFLSFKTLEMIVTLKQQYVEILSDIGFIKKGIRLRNVQMLQSILSGSDGVVEITGAEVNVNNKNKELLSALLVAALYPNIIQAVTNRLFTRGARRIQFNTRSGEEVDIHPSSVNFKNLFDNGSFLVYHEKVKTKKVYIRECSQVTSFPLLMFAGGDFELSQNGDYTTVKIDQMIRFRVKPPEAANLLKSLRSELDRLLADKIARPEMDLTSCPQSEQIITCIVNLISKNHWF